MHRSALVSGCILSATLAAGSAGAATLVSNLAGTTAGNASPQSTFWMAQAFTTDANPYTVNSVSFRGARNAAQTVTVWLYNHDAINDRPVAGATGFGQLNATGVTSVVGVQTLPAIGTINLAANTTYWIVLQPSTIDTSQWTQTINLGNLSGPGRSPTAGPSAATAAPAGAGRPTAPTT